MNFKTFLRSALVQSAIEATPAPILLALCPRTVIYFPHGSSNGFPLPRPWCFPIYASTHRPAATPSDVSSPDYLTSALNYFPL